MEQVYSYKFFGITITENISWSSHINMLVKKAHKRLNFLWKCREAEFWSLVNFYRGAIEHILTGNIRTVQNITGTHLPASVISQC